MSFSPSTVTGGCATEGKHIYERRNYSMFITGRQLQRVAGYDKA